MLQGDTSRDGQSPDLLVPLLSSFLIQVQQYLLDGAIQGNGQFNLNAQRQRHEEWAEET